MVAFLGLVHLGITGLVLVLGLGRGVDDRRIDDRVGGYLHALVLEMTPDLLEQPLAQGVRFEQMAEVEHRGLIRHPFLSQIDADELRIDSES